jgi:DNA-binding NarL/FixJ family response regulator
MDASDPFGTEHVPLGEPGHPIRVLIVDDHDVLADSLAHVIEAEPDLESVGVAGTLAQAEAMIAETRPDVVLLDHSLPDGSGAEAIPRLRERHPAAQVVVLTASLADAVLVAAIENGATGFVVKTRSLGEVTSAVRAAAAGEAVIAPEVLATILPRLRPSGSAIREELTAREHEVLRLVAEGLTNAAIAAALSLSVHTVRNHISHLCAKLGAHSKLEALSVAMRQGMLPPP